MPEIEQFPRTSLAGTNGLLFDVATQHFDDAMQNRIFAVCRALADMPQIIESVPGMNNLLVLFDSRRVSPEVIKKMLLDLWRKARFESTECRDIEVPVVYGGAFGEDLNGLAEQASLTIAEVIQLHSSAIYSVSSIGAMPGFTYLSGLPPALAWARRSIPRTNLGKGAVIIGGSQAGIMPLTAPSGWHVIGRTDLELFEPHKSPPNRFRLGDRIHFRSIGLES